MSHCIGIDLGTTNSVVAFLEGGRPQVITNEDGNRTTPSVVFFQGEGEVVVGEIAKRYLVANPTHTVSSIKRFVGRRIGEITENARQVHYKLVDDPETGSVLVDLGWRKISPEEVSAEVLKKMKDIAEAYLDADVTEAVITIPAYFNDSQRTATKKAAELAGLEVLRIINEPTAAALAYGLNRNIAEKVAIFDFGGGTFDISILEIQDNLFEVRATNGDTFLGGDNIDHMLFEFIRMEIRQDTGLEIMSDIKATQRVREAAEKAKCELSTMNATTISLPFIISDADGPRHYNREITREEFNFLAMPVFERLIPPCRNALLDAGLVPAEIDAVILVGGSTRIPKVQEIVKEFFGKEPLKTVNPDEAVALGAAIQAGVISGNIEEVLLLDITPLSLGIELADNVYSVLIPRNSTIPTTAKKKFTTVVDNQKNVFVHVLQGERKVASQNRSLSHFRLTGITPAPRELPEIEVRFNVDANGILNVSAMDLTSGHSEEIQVQSYHAAPPGEVEREIREAEENQEEEAAFLERHKKRQKARRVMQLALNFIEGEGLELSAEDVRGLEEIINYLKDALSKDDFEALERWEKTLLNMCEQYGERFRKYRSAQ